MDRKTPRDVAPKPPELDLEAFQQVEQPGGLSLDQLGAALAGMLNSGDDPYAPPPADPDAGPVEALGAAADASADDQCELGPRSILEAMLFVGDPNNQPLTSKAVATLMRGVRPAEIDALVRDLNVEYAARNCPYTIVAEGAGYRLKLRPRYDRLRDQFYGKARQARLSQAAIEVLAAVAYRSALSSEEISKLRGKPSGHLLTQLVRRQLLQIERGAGPRRAQYRVTARFLELFGLANLDELPRNPDLEEL